MRRDADEHPANFRLVPVKHKRTIDHLTMSFEPLPEGKDLSKLSPEQKRTVTKEKLRRKIDFCRHLLDRRRRGELDPDEYWPHDLGELRTYVDDRLGIQSIGSKSVTRTAQGEPKNAGKKGRRSRSKMTAQPSPYEEEMEEWNQLRDEMASAFAEAADELPSLKNFIITLLEKEAVFLSLLQELSDTITRLEGKQHYLGPMLVERGLV
ncbi:hypothetical protein ELI48_10120 [Rhizobium ruizarguesonis]|uniref:hypothetical protein n=1 Tax=Rhizobium ruizarguesonis TaxID=2081791 RepID=UPI00102FC9C6|nr:hypothetical protein [Rhizobium ruizarguesonis]TAU26491.1 hypothetical protein ELI48_10120 [Rhizobium ruizarguesonis]